MLGYRTVLFVAAVIACGSTQISPGFAQSISGEDPVASMTQKLTSAMEKGDVSALAALLSAERGRLFLNLDSAIKKANASRIALNEALREKFSVPDRSAPMDLSSAFRQIDHIIVKNQKRIDPNNIEVEWEFHWKQRPQAAYAKAKLVRQGEWKLETASGTDSQIMWATGELEKIIKQYNEVGAISEGIAKGIKGGTYASPWEVRIAWQKAVLPYGSKKQEP